MSRVRQLPTLGHIIADINSLFLVPLMGGIGDIKPPIWQYIPLIVLANWVMKNATDPTKKKGTFRKLH